MYTRLIIPVLTLAILSVHAESSEYVVKPGDTVYGIANANGIDPQTLLDINNIELPELLLPGTVLSLSEEHGEYTVAPGDTLYGIARQYDISIDDLRDLNSLSEDTIIVGQRLAVPLRRETVEESDRTPAVTVPLVVAESIPFDADGTWPASGEKQRLEGKLPGVVIRAERDSPVQAIASGRVVYSGPHTSFGNVIFVESAAGYIYVYGGQESVDVGVGESVQAGTRIGTTSDELYFSVWKDNHFIDPEIAPRG